MSYDSTILAESTLTHYYKCNETSGTTLSDSKGSANLTVGMDVFGSPGAYPVPAYAVNSIALLMDGEPSVYLEYGDDVAGQSYSRGASGYAASSAQLIPTGTGNVTVELWCELYRTPSDYAVMFLHGGSGNSCTVMLDNTQHLGDGTTFGSFVFAASTLYHVVYTYDGTTTLIYVNGTVQFTRTATRVSTVSGNAYLGTNNDLSAFGYYFPGNMSKLAIYSSALTSTDITAHYTLGTTNLRDVRVTQEVAEVVLRGSATDVRITQTVSEVILVGAAKDTRITQSVVEVLLNTPWPVVKRGGMAVYQLTGMI
jgi:hypothetical protein